MTFTVTKTARALDRKDYIVRIPDDKFPLFLNLSMKITKIIKPNTNPLLVYKDLWHDYLDKNYIERCLGERLRHSNWVTRQVHWIQTDDGIEGFIPIPRYNPRALFPKDSNPPIYYIYKVTGNGVYYFK